MTDMVALVAAAFGADETVAREGARPVAVKQTTSVDMTKQDDVALAA